MNRRQMIIVSITGIFIVILALVGLTYAYFLTRITGNEKPKSIEVTTANLSVTYNDDMDGDGEPDALMVFENIMPSNTETYTKTFKVENTGNATAKYSVVLDNMINDFDRNPDLQYTLTREGESTPVAEGNLVVGTKQILIPNVEIENEGVHTYTLTIKYIEAGVDQSIDMGKNLSFRVNIEEEIVTWDTATNGTLLYALKNNQPAGTEETIPGREISTANEARILTTEDDYGTSYVYRGKVENNYVTYSNMCWRIVRVQGDGTIKLALADWAHPCGTENGYNVNDNSGYIADAEGDISLIAYKNNAAKDATDFLFENSDIPLALSTWTNDNNLDISQLVDAEWCNNTAHTENRYFDDNWYEVPAGSSLINYDNTVKIYGAMGGKYYSTAEPSLKCNTKGIEGTTGTEAKATRYKNLLGILSADELAFAGFTDYTDNTYIALYEDVYLYTNANNDGYWTMSPASIDGGHTWVWVFGYDNHDLDYTTVTNDEEYGVRPAIVLQSNVKIEEGGIGTQDKPYVIFVNQD